MKELLQKFKRMTSVLKVKELRQRDLELHLRVTTQERDRVQNELIQQQELYLHGITKINEKRQSRQRDGLDMIEAHVETIKNNWIELYKQRQELERRIPILAQELSHIMKQIEVIEGMQSKNTQARNLFIANKTQEELDFLFSIKSSKGPL